MSRPSEKFLIEPTVIISALQTMIKGAGYYRIVGWAPRDVLNEIIVAGVFSTIIIVGGGRQRDPQDHELLSDSSRLKGKIAGV